ncbi:MAG: hypothetical protein Q7U04_12695, partial [Bacteriovorax sp.]|nr:hypothetical protein [Bacteriovorax sp.]
GKKQGDDFYVLKIACAASMWATCYTMTGGWACPVAVACTAAALLGQSNGNSCQYGGASTANHIIDRQEACDKLGTEDMFNTANNPTMTASKTIRDRCLATGDVVLSGVGNGCSNHSSDGAGPYTPCDQASDAYKRNMVQCSLDVLKEGETANLADAGVSSLIGRKFVLDASVKISRALDLRMASPRQRLIVWEAFSNLAEAASNTNKDMIVAIKAQLDKLQKIIEDLEKISKGIKTNNASDVTFKNNSAEFNSGNSATIQNSDAIALKNKIACITTSIEGACLSPADALLKMDSYNNLSSNLQDPTQQVAKGYNSFTGRSSLSSSELTSAGRLTNNQLKAISDELLKKKKLLQALSAKSGKAWDPKLEASQFKSSLNSAFSNAIKNSGLTAKQLNASSSNQLASNAVNDKTGSDANSAAKLKSFNSNILNGENSNGFFGTKSSNTGGVKKDSSDSKADEVQNSQAQNDANNARLLTESIEARNKANESKYSSSQENTLFENITNAYIRNYDKLLTRKVIKLEK